ncbi:MAG: Gfo/Idh/MocA family oxidoreductase [Herpetosiphonaceae bacterium]|nr:Gfo/Idh/MocA family oxidoreductase [Herpetosiphonaceae bacterium]
MQKKARIAIIGTGWWSTFTHIPAIQQHADAELVALCDAVPRRLQAAADAFGVEQRYTDYHQMLATEQPDGVIVATPHATHFQIARACLEHGVHVVVEKPMVLYANDARILVETARVRGCELIVGYPWHYSPHVLQARAVSASGLLGAVQFVSCIFCSGIRELLSGHDASDHPGAYPVHGPGAVYSQPHLSGGGMGHLQITHAAGLLFFVSGLRARRVLGLMSNHGLPLDLVDSMTVEFDGGALGVVGGTGNGIQRKLDLQIHCEHGAIDMDLVRTTTTIRGPGDVREELEPFADEDAGYPRFAPANNLVEIILGRATNGSPGEIGQRTVELLDAAYRSAGQGGQAVAITDLYHS